MEPRRQHYARLFAFAAALLSAPSFAADGEDNELLRQAKSNIVILLADDLGWGDVGYHDPQVVTPNICLLYTSDAADE